MYTWDITYLPTPIRGLYFYLYLFLDVFSRKIVGWQVYEEESSLLASEVIRDLCRREQIAPDQVVLHADNGGPMKGATMLATLQSAGRDAVVQPTGGEQRQPVFGITVSNLEVSAGLSIRVLCQPVGRSAMGERLCSVVQP